MMRILILTPSAFPDLTGNATTTERWRRSLTEKGLIVEVLSTNGADTFTLKETLRRFRPDLIHAYHAFKTGVLLLDPQLGTGNILPLVVSPGGTDVNLDFGESEKRESISQVLLRARIIVAQSCGIAQSLKNQMPELAGKMITVPKAYSWFGNESCALREMARCRREHTLFFLPAGIRPVKGNLECLLALEQVHALRPQIRFVAAGPPIDITYASRFEHAMDDRSSFACWVRAIPPPAMRSAYEASDIVLNTSFSEGLSNSLIEAVAAGRPFLASDIPGNRQPALFGEGTLQAGCYFDPRHREDFVNKALRLIDDDNFRNSLREAARRQQSRLPTPEQEADGLIAAYRTAITQNVSSSTRT